MNGVVLPLEVERQVLVWFEPKDNPGHFAPDRCPIFLWDHGQDRHFYGFPNMGTGVKVALMHQGEEADPYHFLIDFHPESPQTLIASPCSGHGFKFASAIGEILAELLVDGRSRLNIDLFRLDRFTTARA